MTDREQMSGPHECGDAAAYVLGALDPQESAAFVAHLEQCSICRDEVEQFGVVVSTLPTAVAQHRVSRGLRRRVMREVRREPHVASYPARSSRASWSPAAFGRRTWAAAGSFCAVAAAAGVAALTVFSGGGASVFNANVMGVSGTAQVRVTNGHAELVVRHMTAPGKRHVYEVWLQSGKSQPVPASVLFSVSADGNAEVGLPADTKGVSAVLVTPEPLGGSKHPTHTPVIVAKLD
jgi:anti-sigma-K factor RskA